MFLVTDGNYSDYHNVAIFSTREKAEEFISEIYSFSRWNDGGRIEEMILDEIEESHKYITVGMFKDGTVQDTYPSLSEKPVITNYKFWKHSEQMEIAVPTDNIEKAIKVANEYRTRLIAEDKWGVIN